MNNVLIIIFYTLLNVSRYLIKYKTVLDKWITLFVLNVNKDIIITKVNVCKEKLGTVKNFKMNMSVRNVSMNIICKMVNAWNQRQ